MNMQLLDCMSIYLLYLQHGNWQMCQINAVHIQPPYLRPIIGLAIYLFPCVRVFNNLSSNRPLSNRRWYLQQEVDYISTISIIHKANWDKLFIARICRSIIRRITMISCILHEYNHEVCKATTQIYYFHIDARVRHIYQHCTTLYSHSIDIMTYRYEGLYISVRVCACVSACICVCECASVCACL